MSIVPHVTHPHPTTSVQSPDIVDVDPSVNWCWVNEYDRLRAKFPHADQTKLMDCTDANLAEKERQSSLEWRLAEAIERTVAQVAENERALAEMAEDEYQWQLALEIDEAQSGHSDWRWA